MKQEHMMPMIVLQEPVIAKSLYALVHFAYPYIMFGIKHGTFDQSIVEISENEQEYICHDNDASQAHYHQFAHPPTSFCLCKLRLFINTGMEVT